MHRKTKKGLVFELNEGASFATRKLDANLNTGFGFEGIFHYRFMPFTGVYTGWGWNKFASDLIHLQEKMQILKKPDMFLDFSLNIHWEIFLFHIL
ncbi:MAG: hypothetical protein MZV63_44770 [Marinilabiliales bacterium]|nr:hypothetical protein [Marinilabiliales bacterium]